MVCPLFAPLFAQRIGSSLTYLYDFGDSWEHQVVVEKITPLGKQSKLPQCTTGTCACPPEDVGGIYGYERMLKILRKPGHEEYEETLEWLGDDFDPKAFDKETVNCELQQLRQQQITAEWFIELLDELVDVSEDEEPGDEDLQYIERYFPEGGEVRSKRPNYDSLYGYLTAIICAPQPTPPVEWMLGLYEVYELEIAQQSEFTALMFAVYRLYNQLTIGQAEHRPYLPEPCDLDTTPVGTTTTELWCDGFLHGFTYNEEDWFDLHNEEIEEEVGSCIAIISALAMRELGDDNMLPQEFKEKMAVAQEHLKSVVLALYDLARSEHYAHLTELDNDDWITPPSPVVSTKIGRNEPCLCGSGLKYKKCCIGKVVPIH